MITATIINATGTDYKDNAEIELFESVQEIKDAYPTTFIDELEYLEGYEKYGNLVGFTYGESSRSLQLNFVQVWKSNIKK